jgi:hypothetical protein
VTSVAVNLLETGASAVLYDRVPGALDEQTLAPRESDPAEPAGNPFVSPQRDASAAPHFIAECFFLTQRAIHTCLMPAGARQGSVFHLDTSALLERHCLAGAQLVCIVVVCKATALQRILCV